MIYWNYSVDNTNTPSVNIKRLLNALSFKTLEFITYESTVNKGGPSDTYFINEVSMTGTVEYLKPCLKESFNKLNLYLESFLESDEAAATKLYELSMSRFNIKKYFYENDSNDLTLLDSSFSINLTSRNDMFLMEVRLGQCELSSMAYEQINEHQHVRRVYLTLLDDYISLLIEKINLKPAQEKLKNEEINTGKELQLLEVWIGLKEAGFMDFLDTNKLKLAEHRERFFELFQLIDMNYNDRHSSLKTKKNPAEFLETLVGLLNKYRKKKN